MDEFNSDPFLWGESVLLDYLKSIKISKKLIDRLEVIQCTGQNFLINDDDKILRFFQAATEEEKSQLMFVKNAIKEKKKQFSDDFMDEEEEEQEKDTVDVSYPVTVIGQNMEVEEKISLVKNNTTLEGSNTQNIEIASSRIESFNYLPYDPFDFDATLNFEAAKKAYEIFLPKWSLFLQFLDLKSKRNQQKPIEMQLILEVKKALEKSSTFALEKFAIKQNQAATLGQCQCDLILRDESVSRKHALVESKIGFCTVQDLGSSCGTFLKIKNTQMTLQVGSIFECGFQEFQVTSIIPNGDQAKIQLLLYDGSVVYKGKIFDLSIQNHFLIGKDSRCHFGSQFQDDTDLSSYHAKLSMKDNVLSIMDLDSTKGTWLRLAPVKKESAKFQIFNDSEIKILPFIITVKINQIGIDPLLSLNTQSFSQLCMICKTNKANQQLLPCQHVICCSNCFPKLNAKQCPLPDCKQPIKQVETIFNN